MSLPRLLLIVKELLKSTLNNNNNSNLIKLLYLCTIEFIMQICSQ